MSAAASQEDRQTSQSVNKPDRLLAHIRTYYVRTATVSRNKGVHRAHFLKTLNNNRDASARAAKISSARLVSAIFVFLESLPLQRLTVCDGFRLPAIYLSGQA